MTEYDYSPAAYERYLEKLARVEHWVTDQRYCAPRYSNPFASANAGQSSAHVPRGSSRPRDVVPSRTRAMSPTGQGTQPRQSSSSRSRSQPRAAPIRSQTMPNTQHRAVVYPSNHTPPHVVHHPQHAAVPPIPAGANAVYRTYEYDPRSGKDIVLPPPRPGETYVIIPPGGRKLEVVGGSSGSGSRSTSRSSTRSPTKRDPPLFKRLFTGFHTSNHDRQSPSGHHRSDSGSRRQRRLSY